MTHTCDSCHGSGERRGAVRTFDCPPCDGTGQQTETPPGAGP